MVVADLIEELARCRSEATRLGAELTAERRLCDELKVAVDTNRRIGAAIGILMTRHGITEEQSFELLKGASQTSQRKLRDVAVDVVDKGMLEPQQMTDLRPHIRPTPPVRARNSGPIVLAPRDLRP